MRSVTSRIRLMGVGLGIIALLSVPLVWLSWSSFGSRSSLTFGVATVLWIQAFVAPVFVLTVAVDAKILWLSRLALAATVAPPVFASRWAAMVTVAGLVLWLLCTLIVVGAPA